MCGEGGCCSWRLGAIIVSILLIVSGIFWLIYCVVPKNTEPILLNGPKHSDISFSVLYILFGIQLLVGACIQNRWIVLAFVVLYPLFILAMGIVQIVYFKTNDLEHIGVIIASFVINLVFGAIQVFVAFMYYRKLRSISSEDD